MPGKQLNQNQNKQEILNNTKERKSLKELHELFIKYKLHASGTAPSSIKGYCQTFGLLLQFKPEITLEDLTEETMINFFEFLNTRLRKVGKQYVVRVYKKSSIASVRGKLNTFFKWLIDRNYIEINPFHHIEYPNVTYTDPRAFTATEFEKICYAVNTKIRWANLLIKKRNIAIVMLLAYSGLRKEELIGLKLPDVELDRKLITVRAQTSKSKRARIIPMNAELIPYLEDYLNYRKEYSTNYFWVSGTLNREFTEHGLKHLCNLISKVTKINCHWHRYRHTFATNFYNLTRDILALHVLMGHSSLRMTLTYLRSLADQHLVNQIKKITVKEFV